MKIRIIALSLAAVGGLTLVAQSFKTSAEPVAPAALPTSPQTQPVELLSAAEFTLERPATHWYRAEQPSYTRGLLLTLHVNEDLATARQTYEPVLYVGSETAERVNHGLESGNLVVIVPNLSLEDLANEPIFFGTPELPERVSAEMAMQERETAFARGVATTGAQRIERVLDEPFVVFDDTELRTKAAELIEAYSPAEMDVVEGLRAPRLR